MSSPFFYKTDQAPKYGLGIGSLLVCNCIEFALFFVFRYAFIWENKKKQRLRGGVQVSEADLNATAFQDLTDKQNPKSVWYRNQDHLLIINKFRIRVLRGISEEGAGAIWRETNQDVNGRVSVSCTT